MGKRIVLLLVASAVLAAILLWGFGAFDEPEDQWYRDIRRGHWIWWGAEEHVLDQTLAKIASADGKRRDHRFDTMEAYGPGNWTYEFSQLGKARRSAAAAARAAGDTELAADLYHQASVYFGLAKYPGYGIDPHENQAHELQLEAYELAHTLKDSTVFSVLEIPVGDREVRGYLHQPSDLPGPLPLVIGTNGIDVFKAEFGPIVDALVENGIAFFAFDMPSTGEAAAFPLRPENDEIYLEVMQALRRRADIDEDRVALWGVSFGGNPVVRAAQKAPAGLRAVVNWCGPIHDVFQISEFQLSLVADMYLDALKHRTHMPDADAAELIEVMRGFSLVDSKLIQPGQVTTRVPILSVNASGDYVAPESDLELVSQSTANGELFYSGSDDHCPQDRYTASARTVDWLLSHF